MLVNVKLFNLFDNYITSNIVRRQIEIYNLDVLCLESSREMWIIKFVSSG